MLRGERTTLRALQDCDAELLRGWRNHPELFGLHFSHTLLSQVEQRRWYETYSAERGVIVYIIENEQGAPIGYTLIKDLDHKNRQAEVGVHLAPDFQRKGYGKDAFGTLVRYCFGELNLHRVYLHVFAFNQRAIRLYESLGFQHEGRLRESCFTQNAYHDVLVMSLLRREYEDAESED